MRISDWSSDVCSSDLLALLVAGQCDQRSDSLCLRLGVSRCESLISRQQAGAWLFGNLKFRAAKRGDGSRVIASFGALGNGDPFVKIRIFTDIYRRGEVRLRLFGPARSEEHTSELQSLMRIS